MCSTLCKCCYFGRIVSKITAGTPMVRTPINLARGLIDYKPNHTPLQSIDVLKLVKEVWECMGIPQANLWYYCWVRWLHRWGALPQTVLSYKRFWNGWSTSGHTTTAIQILRGFLSGWLTFWRPVKGDFTSFHILTVSLVTVYAYHATANSYYGG